MPEALDISGANGNSTHNAPHDSVKFCSLHELQAASESHGWSITYRQLQAGRLRAKLAMSYCAGITLLDEFYSRRVEVVGSSPDRHLTVVIPADVAEIWVNGESFNNRSIVLHGPCVDVHAVVHENGRILSMHVPISLLRESGVHIFDTREGHSLRQTSLIDTGKSTSNRLRSIMRAAIHEPGTGRRRQSELAGLLVAAVAEIVNRHAGTSESARQPSAVESFRTIKRAREFIEAHLAEPIRIGEVCASAAASLSKLERTFRRELQMTPSEYILSRRLAAVHRELKRIDSADRKIVQVAMDHGFNHQGRFANSYRNHFGELPSETLRSA